MLGVEGLLALTSFDAFRGETEIERRVERHLMTQWQIRGKNPGRQTHPGSFSCATNAFF